MEPFLLRALAGGLGVALAAGPLGCFVLWRRLTFFGDTLAHSALLGIALGLLLHLPIALGVLTLCGTLALVLTLTHRQRLLPSDTLLGIFSPTALALGLIALNLADPTTITLESALFGDILSVTSTDLWSIYTMAALVLILLRWQWQPLLALSLHPALAEAEGIRAQPRQLLLTLLLAGFVAIAMQVVGILLTTALLILPAASARLLASTPERMAIFATLAGMASIGLGLCVSLQGNIPTGPAMVVGAASILLTVTVYKRLHLI